MNVTQRRSRGFSLIEIMVVVGIIATLVGVTVIYLAKARKQASRVRQASDFQAIATALEAYKTDFGDYPRPDAGQHGIGFTLLGMALVGPGPQNHAAGTPNLPRDAFSGGTHYEGGEVVYSGTNVYYAIAHNESGTAPPDTNKWAATNWQDGADGPGFRLRNRGRTYGPYLQPEKFRVRGYAILDVWDNPILYFPGRTGTVNVNQPQSFMWDSRDKSLNPTTGAKPLYDYADNFGMLAHDALIGQPATQIDMAPVLYLLGDYSATPANAGYNGNGKIDEREAPVTTGPYILWSAGPDAEGNHEFHYGLINAEGEPDINGKTDDVTNFDIPVDLLKK